LDLPNGMNLLDNYILQTPKHLTSNYFASFIHKLVQPCALRKIHNKIDNLQVSDDTFVGHKSHPLWRRRHSKGWRNLEWGIYINLWPKNIRNKKSPDQKKKGWVTMILHRLGDDPPILSSRLVNCLALYRALEYFF
jgi:hypothetical protein